MGAETLDRAGSDNQGSWAALRAAVSAISVFADKKRDIVSARYRGQIELDILVAGLR